MTDTEQKRIKAICDVAHVDDISDLSDGYHTFRQLYYQRMMLFVVIVKQNRDKAWKSLRHEDGELCFGGGWFIVGIDTPEGSYTYHYENKYFDLFDCEILDYAKHWDGHTEKDVTRLLSLEQETSGDVISRQYLLDNCVVDKITMPYVPVNKIENAPPVAPQPKTGYWIYDDECKEHGHCSRCGYGSVDLIDGEPHNYCPNCGAKMFDLQESEEV